MTTFYASSETEQSAWMICLFFALLLDVFLFLTSLDRGGRRWSRLFNVGTFIALLILLCTAGDAFQKKAAGLPADPLLPFPMWLLWCIAGMAGFASRSGCHLHPSKRPDTQSQFRKTGHGYAAQCRLLFHPFRCTQTVQSANAPPVPHTGTQRSPAVP